MKESWWLMVSSFPDLNWARLRVGSKGDAEILDMDGNEHFFKSESAAINWLLEDEYTQYSKLDQEDEIEYGIKLSNINCPAGSTRPELVKKMYVRTKA